MINDAAADPGLEDHLRGRGHLPDGDLGHRGLPLMI